MNNFYAFPSWNYGYTLNPETGTQYYKPPRGGHRGHHHRGHGRGGGIPINKEPAAAPTPAPVPTPAPTPAVTEPPKPEVEEKEDGEIIERPLDEILRGRNAIVYCNEQSKMRRLRIEWEQVSETGPPHNKIFTWSIKMGEIMTMGTANNKKGAKNKAAEEMARKLDKLPRPEPKFNNPMMRGGFVPRGNPNFRGGYAPRGFQGHSANVPPWAHKKSQKRKLSEPSEESEVKEMKLEEGGSCQMVPDSPYQSLNNPISKLYEFCKHNRLPEPHFETIEERVLEQKKSQKGFIIKKTMFTIQCDVMGKKFCGASMTKKQAKQLAAENAWAEFSTGSKS